MQCEESFPERACPNGSNSGRRDWLDTATKDVGWEPQIDKKLASALLVGLEERLQTLGLRREGTEVYPLRGGLSVQCPVELPQFDPTIPPVESVTTSNQIEDRNVDDQTQPVRLKASRRAKDLLGKLLLMVVSSLSALLIAEFTLNYLYPLGGPPRIHEYDANLGHRMKPNLDLLHVWDGRENVTRIRTNTLGLRSPELSSAKDAHEYRMLFLGDSYTFGYGVSEEDSFPRVLEKSLVGVGEAGQRYTAVNAGVSGYGTAQELLQYRSLGQQLHPDLVILGFFMGNDVQDNGCLATRTLRASSRAPCFEVQNRQLRIKSRPLAPRERRASQLSFLKAIGGWVKDSQVYGLIKGRGVQFLTGRPGVVSFLDRLGLDLQPGYLPHVVAGWYLPQVVDTAWPLTQELIRSLNEEVEANHATLAVVLIPSRVQVIPELFEVSKVVYRDVLAVAEFLGNPMRPQTMMMQFLSAEGIPALDLMPVLRATGEGGSLYYPSCAHWNERGHQIAAEAIRDFLERDRLLGQPSA